MHYHLTLNWSPLVPAQDNSSVVYSRNFLLVFSTLLLVFCLCNYWHWIGRRRWTPVRGALQVSVMMMMIISRQCRRIQKCPPTCRCIAVVSVAETGYNSEADDKDGEQACEEGSAGSVQADPDVHGRQKDRPRSSDVQSLVRNCCEGLECRGAERRDLYSDLPTDNKKLTRVSSSFHRAFV